MAIDSRAALDGLIGALEAFHLAATSAQDPDAESVLEASDALAEAYTLYDDVMFTQYEIEAPLDVYPLEEEDEDDLDDLDDDDLDDFEDDDFEDDSLEEDDVLEDEEVDDDDEFADGDARDEPDLDTPEYD